MTQEPKRRAGDRRPQGGGAQNQGGYISRRRGQDAERGFAGRDSQAEREAGQALDEIEISEGRSRPHPPAPKAGGSSDPHTEENLDKGLEETFPASDPVSISPGAD
jgi:hypothetical protein